MAWQGQTDPYIGALEARVLASNKKRVYGLVHPNPLAPAEGSLWFEVPLQKAGAFGARLLEAITKKIPSEIDS